MVPTYQRTSSLGLRLWIGNSVNFQAMKHFHIKVETGAWKDAVVNSSKGRGRLLYVQFIVDSLFDRVITVCLDSAKPK